MKTRKLLALTAALLMVAATGCAASKKGLTADQAQKAIAGKDGLFAIIDTDNGAIACELFYKDAPLTVTNFVGLAEGTLNAAKGKPFYDGLKFHRVISKANGDNQDFMIQGGDPRGNGTGGPGYTFPDEFVPTLRHDKPGRLSMANSGCNTNGSQFFITIAPTTWLDDVHTIFGEVVFGQETANTLKQGAAIKTVTIVRQGDDAKKFTATQADWDRLYQEAFMKQITSFLSVPVKHSSGIYYQTVEEGKGPAVGKGRNVSCAYIGALMNGKVFDYSRDGSTLDFTTNGGQMITGFDLMVQEMKVGETRICILPPQYAYGNQSVGGVIPANSWLVFQITLEQAK